MSAFPQGLPYDPFADQANQARSAPRKGRRPDASIRMEITDPRVLLVYDTLMSSKRGHTLTEIAAHIVSVLDAAAVTEVFQLDQAVAA